MKNKKHKGTYSYPLVLVLDPPFIIEPANL